MFGYLSRYFLCRQPGSIIPPLHRELFDCGDIEADFFCSFAHLEIVADKKQLDPVMALAGKHSVAITK